LDQPSDAIGSPTRKRETALIELMAINPIT